MFFLLIAIFLIYKYPILNLVVSIDFDSMPTTGNIQEFNTDKGKGIVAQAQHVEVFFDTNTISKDN